MTDILINVTTLSLLTALLVLSIERIRSDRANTAALERHSLASRVTTPEGAELSGGAILADLWQRQASVTARLDEMAEQVRDLHRWHDVRGADGVPAWYVRDELVAALRVATDAYEATREDSKKTQDMIRGLARLFAEARRAAATASTIESSGNAGP